jgi:hypothetical protein
VNARRLVALNRALWIAAAALLAASVLVSGYWFGERKLSTPKPLELPAIDGLAKPAPALAALPQRNPFDPAGVAWHASGAAPDGKDQKQVAGLQDVRGIVASSVMSGVFTVNGLIKTGEPFGGGTLEKVSREELVLRMPDGTTKSLPLAKKADDPLRDRLIELFAGRPQ